jgi:DNA polymerase-3 subunit delta'
MARDTAAASRAPVAPPATLGLDAIEGQPRAVDLLRRALETERIAHAYAFVGPAGSGRTTTALAFARALLCPAAAAPAGSRALLGCGACRACALVAARQHPDLHLVVPTPPDKNPRGPLALRIAAIRELERQAALRPAQAARKVFILDDADRMTGEAPEAFLKTLEEPPARTILILVLARALALPATVLSRCQVVRFQPRADVVAEAGRAEAAQVLAEVQAGGAEALLRRGQAYERDRDKAERFVDGCRLVLRDLLLVRAGAPADLLHGDAEALAGEAARWTMDELLQGLAFCREARLGLAVNVNPRLTIEVILGRLAVRAA